MSRSELIRRALEHEIPQARAAAERRTMAEDLRAIGCDPVARRFAQDLDAALGEPLPLAREAWWKA